MKTQLILIALCLIGCAQSDPKGQWVLESYSADTGYILQKDGVEFRARCYNSTPPNANSLETRENWERITNGKGPDNSECSEILVYLHKAAPLTQEYGDDRLAYKDERGVVYEFQIKRGKMTPKQVISVNFSEIQKVEITCKCGAALIFPIPRAQGQAYPPQNYHCPSCEKKLWSTHQEDDYKRLFRLIEALGQWQALQGQNYDLSFSLNSN